MCIPSGSLLLLGKHPAIEGETNEFPLSCTARCRSHVEVIVHGAHIVCQSGRCTLSDTFAGIAPADQRGRAKMRGDIFREFAGARSPPRRTFIVRRDGRDFVASCFAKSE